MKLKITIETGLVLDPDLPPNFHLATLETTPGPLVHPHGTFKSFLMVLFPSEVS